jgi:hypothetical protein
MITQPVVYSYPNYLDVPSRRLLAYLLVFGSLTQFGDPSMGDRTNCGLSESRGTRAVAPKRE